MNITMPELPDFLNRSLQNSKSESVEGSARPGKGGRDAPKAALEFHELAKCFPLMEGAEYEALVSDLKLHGQREPIVIHDGKILDGRNRFRACIDAGVQPKTIDWDRQGTPADFVTSGNIVRRHLSPSQLGMAGARIANLKPGHVGHQIAQAEGGRQICPPISNQRAADMLGVSRHTITDSKKVLTHGTPAEIAAVDRGVAAASTMAAKIRSEARTSGSGKKPSPVTDQAENSHILVGHFLKKLATLASKTPADSDFKNALRERPELLASLVNTLPALRMIIQVVEGVAVKKDPQTT